MIKMIKIPKNIAVPIYFSILTGAIILIFVLVWQYKCFVQEVQELIFIKESYCQHVEMLKRSLNNEVLSENSTDSEDEPDEIDSKKDNLVFEASQPDVFIITADEEDIVKNSEPRFALIGPEEESQLKSIKRASTKPKAVVSKSKKKNKRNKSSVQLSKRFNRYAPQSDFPFAWPIELSKFWLSSLYGPRRLSNRKVAFHHGIDMASVRGTPVKAAAAGKVVCAYSVSGYGNCVDIVHNSHYKTRYAHLHSIKVQVGQQVDVGQLIGTVGSTGFVRKSGNDASHLHFEIHHDGHTVNPLKYLFT